MQTKVLFVLMISLTALLFSCKSPETKMVTLPFEVSYTGNYTDPGSPDTKKCADQLNVIVDGIGKGTYVGKSSIHFNFCVMPPKDKSGDAEYGNTDAYILAENGDTLYVTVSGKVITGRSTDHPEHVTSYWRDPFEILGGSGKFKGASGNGMTDDFNSTLDANSHHSWKGTISMMKLENIEY